VTRHAHFGEIRLEVVVRLRVDETGGAGVVVRHHSFPVTLTEVDPEAVGEHRHLAILDPDYADNGAEMVERIESRAAAIVAAVSAAARSDAELFRIVFTEQDVHALADENDVPGDLALARAREWAPRIASTATTLCNEQLASAVATDQP
jgi:hypothetical protein